MKNIKTNPKQEKYWTDRFQLSQSMGDKTETEILKTMQTVYKESLSNIQKEINAFYGKYAEQNTLTISDVKKRLDPMELKSAKEEISRYYHQIDKLARKSGKVQTSLLRQYSQTLKEQSAKAYLSRLEELKIYIMHEAVKLGVRESEVFDDKLGNLYNDTYSHKSYEIDKYMGFSNGFSERNVEKAINERWLGANYSDRIWQNKDKLINGIETTFLQGVARGQNPKKIASELNKTMQTGFYNCERLCRTETIHILNEATMDSYKDHNIERYQFVCGLDERTCPICGSLDGEIFDLKDKMEGVNYPVLHPNCVLPDNIVWSPDAEKMTRSYYSGDVIKVRTSKGGWFSITPNHIMLTSRGWVRGKNLVKGDKVINYVGWDEFIKNPTNNNCIPTVENLFTSFSKLPFVFTESMKSTSKDFKGDIVENTKIDIININSLLWNKINVPFKKFISDGALIFTRKFGKRFFSRGSTMAKFLMCIGFASDGIMSCIRVFSMFFRRSISHHKLIGFRLTSDYNSRLEKSVINNGSCNIKDFSKFINACSSIIQFDDIIDIQISNFSGHVYDFSSESTLYICNGYLSSNCRCTTIPYFEPDEIDDMFEESTRIANDEDGEYYDVPSSMTYDEWREMLNASEES